jgi:hypothetical protein
MRRNPRCTLQSVMMGASFPLRSAVEGAGAHPQLGHGRTQPRLTDGEMQAQALASSARRAMLAHLGGAHTCICAASSCRRDKASADVSALQSSVSLPLVSPITPAKRSRCPSRASSTRSRMAALGSPSRSSASLSYSTRGTSTWMSTSQSERLRSVLSAAQGCALPSSKGSEMRGDRRKSP